MPVLIAALVLPFGVAEAPFYANKAELMVYIDAAGAAVPVKSAEDWALRRDHILRNMQAVMGPLPEEAKRVPLDVQVESEEDMGSYVRRKISYAAEPGDRVPAYLLIPKGEGKRPAMLCLHPTSDRGKDQIVGLGDRTNRNYAEELAQRGYVCIVPDYPTQGEYQIDAYALGYESCTMKGIWNHIRGVDVLAAMPEVDPERVGAIGHSLGGHNTLYVGVFEPRIKVMVTSCGFNPFPQYKGGDLTGWCGHRYMPKIETVYGKDPAKMPFDFYEVLGALAPRAVFVNAPLRDDNFLTGADECVAAAKPVYALFGAEEKIVITRPDCEHDFPPATREAAYAFVDRVLKPGT